MPRSSGHRLLGSEERAMSRVSIACITLAGLGFLVACGSSRAQGLPYPQVAGSPGTYPVYSPYLNLLRRDNPLFQNYYGLVRPELAFRSSIIGLEQQVQVNQLGIATVQNALTVPTTGHATFFMNRGAYFMNQVGQGTGAVLQTTGSQVGLPIGGVFQQAGGASPNVAPRRTVTR
jgi:hypothetical protein